MNKSFDFLPSAKKREATRILPWVLAIMVYLSILSATGSLLIHDGIDDWANSLKGHITVQVTGEDRDLIRQHALEIEEILKSTPGVLSVRILSDDEISILLEPWLGAGNITSDLPIPTMLDFEIAPDAYINLDALISQLSLVTENVDLDDHAEWLSHFFSLTAAIEYTAIGILVLILIASVSIVMFATKSGLAEHKKTIEIMHLMGAQDKLIAQAYQKRFMMYGLKGGLYGLFVAILTIYGLFYLIQDLAAGLVEIPTLPYMKLMVLLFFPVLFGLLTMYTARATVMRELARMI